MAIKGVNMFEEHVEKIVLALAVLGAAYMGYAASQKITINGTQVGPRDVEQSIADALAATKNKSATTPPPLAGLDYSKEYRELSQRSPIDDPAKGIALVNAPVPVFGPRNLPLGAVTEGPDRHDYACISPVPVAPLEARAELWEGMVSDGPAPSAAGNGGGGGAAAPAATHDKSAAVIEGYIPLGEMQYTMDHPAKDATAREVIPEHWRKAEIYRIRVQRRERNASGWSEWKDVPATKATAQPTPIDFAGMAQTDVPAALTTVAKEFKQIALPDFYPDDKGAPIAPPILSQQPDKKIQEESDTIQNEIQGAGGGAGGAVAAPAAPAAAGGASPYPSEADAIHNLPVVPFTFWDETVQPNHVYQYQVEVDFLNPLYKWNLGMKDPALAKQEVLTTGWVAIATPIVVNSDLAFYIHGSGAGGLGSGSAISPTVTTRVYKKSNGKWYWNDFTTALGNAISGQIRLLDKPNMPTMDVDTGYTIVDAALNADGNDVHVILKDANGDLISRDSSVDRDDPNDRDLYSKAVKLQATTTTAPAGGEGGAGTQPRETPRESRGTAINPRPAPRTTGTRPGAR